MVRGSDSAHAASDRASEWVTSKSTENEVALVPVLAKGDQIGIETFQLRGALTARQSSLERGWTDACALSRGWHAERRAKQIGERGRTGLTDPPTNRAEKSKPAFRACDRSHAQG